MTDSRRLSRIRSGILSEILIDILLRPAASAAVAFALLACGQIKIAGGASEVGNPSSGLFEGEGEGDVQDEGSVTGIAISAQGTPIRITREKPAPAKDSAQAKAAPDSIPSN